MRMTPDTEESVRCTVSGCNCVCFKPGGLQLRSCDRCGHGWVAHASEKLHFQALQPSGCSPVEVALPGLVFDLSSLVLYGAQAIPVRLKILLDRLYSILSAEEVGHILHTLGWSLGDYVRGYMLQFPIGTILDRWVMVTPDEELLILKHFLRFGETRPIVEVMMRQCLAGVSHLSNPELSPAPKGGGCQRASRGGPRLAAGVSRLLDDIVHRFENLTDGRSSFLPFHFPSSPFRSLVPPTKELLSPGRLNQTLQKPKLAERPSQERRRGEQEYDLVLHQFKPEPPLNIKVDPDIPNPALSVWHQDLHFNKEDELHLPRARFKQQNTFSLSSSLNSSCISTSSSFHPSISSSPPNIPQKFQSSSSYSFNPFPSSSSSFLSPLPSSPLFSSSLHPQTSSSSSLRPLPSSLCSAPSLSSAVGRKGRVCCGICGKSFYDKGTLKIHYNAVHLKIKHRCTVAGCTMVFSSLRSRNRHSANPNPRLHTAACRDGHAHSDLHTSTRPETHKDKIKHTRGEMEVSTPPCIHTLRNGFNGHANPIHNHQETTPPQANPPTPSPQPISCNLSQASNQNFSLDYSRSDGHPQAPSPSSPPRPSLGSPPSLISLVEKTERHRHAAPAAFSYPDTLTVTNCYSHPVSHDHGLADGRQGKMCSSPPSSQPRRWQSGEPVPKKKPRKSSMPVKIEREVGGGLKLS